MIKLKVDKKRPQHYAHVITTDQPMTVEIDVIRGIPIVVVYPTNVVDEFTEPIGAYDGTMGASNNRNWTYDPYADQLLGA